MMRATPKALFDLTRLQEIAQEMDALIAKGQWSQEQYKRLMQEAARVSGGNGDFLSFLRVEARLEWLNESMEDSAYILSGEG